MPELILPSIEDLSTTRGKIKLSEFKGQKIVLYFYPKDNTPGCSSESKSFRDHFDEFKKNNTVILGVSRDSLQSHLKFKEKLKLPFELISDTDETLCEYFNVLGNKTMFGKIFNGLIRSTFLINENGKVIREWRKVKVCGHVEEVLKVITEGATN